MSSATLITPHRRLEFTLGAVPRRSNEPYQGLIFAGRSPFAIANVVASARDEQSILL